MQDLTLAYDYERLLEEEKEHYAQIEVTERLTEGGRHGLGAWHHYWSRVGGEIGRSGYGDLAGLLERSRGGHGRPIRILSLGSGYCGHELELAGRLAAPYELTCMDINPALFAQAQARAHEAGLAMRFELADLNFLRIEPGRYDLIFAHAALHHVINLELLFEQVAHGLTPEGIFHVVEVIGKNRELMWPENHRLASALLAGLPHEATGGHVLDEPVPGEGMEGVRQEEIVGQLRERFDTVYELLHGAFMRAICTDDAFTGLDPATPAGRGYLDFLVDADRAAVRNGVLRPLELWGIYRPRAA